MFPEDPGQVFIYAYTLHPQRALCFFQYCVKQQYAMLSFKA